MDQVQRAYESQLRREDCKRKQLQNSVRAQSDAWITRMPIPDTPRGRSIHPKHLS